MTGTADPDAYDGLPGAFPYAFRRSESRLFKLYVFVGAALSTLIGIVFALALIVLIAETVDTSASLSLSRSFFVLVGLVFVLPILTPILLVARRHRRGIGDDAHYDRRLAVAGFAFIGSLYLGLIPTVPPEHQDVPSGSVPIATFEVPQWSVPALATEVGGWTVAPRVPALVVDGAVAPVVELFYGMPPAAGVVPPLLAIAAIYAAHRVSR